MRLALALLLLFPGTLAAAVIAVASAEGITISLTDEECRMKTQIRNMPNRATWTEGGKTYEGCFTLINKQVVSFWSDLTIAVIPMQIFTKATGT